MSGKIPPPPPPPPPPVSANGADAAQENLDARWRERNRFDFSRTILRPGVAPLGSSSTQLPGTKSTLG